MRLIIHYSLIPQALKRQKNNNEKEMVQNILCDADIGFSCVGSGSYTGGSTK